MSSMEVTFYDRGGAPVAYCEDAEHIYLFSGQPVAYIHGDAIYDFGGRHRGWFSDGWIRDTDGAAVMFTESCSGGPMAPMRQMRPMKSMKTMLPMKTMRTMARMRPMNAMAWSSQSGPEFFA